MINPMPTQTQAPAQQMPGMMQQADPLAQLRDIHLPGALAETWPAPGWWLLALLLALGLSAAIIWLYRHWRSNRYRREALRELQALHHAWLRQGDERHYLNALQHLLKRTALTGFNREQVASLTGESWVAFLDESIGSRDFSTGDAQVLIDGNYNPGISVQVEALHRMAERWVKHHHPKHLKAQIPEKRHETLSGAAT